MTKDINIPRLEVGKPTLTEGGPAPGLKATELVKALSSMAVAGEVVMSMDGLLLVPFHVAVEPSGRAVIHVRPKYPTGGVT